MRYGLLRLFTSHRVGDRVLIVPLVKICMSNPLGYVAVLHVGVIKHTYFELNNSHHEKVNG